MPEIEDDSSMDSLRIGVAGHVKSKLENIHWRGRVTAISFIFAGCGYLSYREHVHRVLAPTYFILPFGAKCRYGPDDRGWEERFVTLSGSRMDEWSRLGWMPETVMRAEMADPAAVEETHEELLTALVGRDGTAINRAKLKMEQLVFDLYSRRQQAMRDPDPVGAIVSSWRTAPERVHDIAAGAAQSGLSYSHFRRVVQRRTGLPPYRFLLKARIDKACAILRAEQASIKEIGHRCGFASTESFVRAFRREVGTTPTLYRRQEARSSMA